MPLIRLAICLLTPDPRPCVARAWDRKGQRHNVWSDGKGLQCLFARVWLHSVGGKVGSRMGLKREGTRKGHPGGQEEPS